MPRSSRHKSHKQSKHSSRDTRGHSDSEEDTKGRDRSSKEESSVRVSKDSLTSEKRKLASQSRDGKDLSGHGNGEAAAEEGVASKRRKERADVGAGDRWNGGGDERGDGVVVDKEMKGVDADKGSKSKVSSDSKSKPSRRHDSEKKEENVGLVMEREESKSGKVESKRKPEKDKPEKEKLEKDSSRREVNQYKDSKEKERGSERDRKVQDGKRDTETRAVDGEVKRKQRDQPVDAGEEKKLKRGTEITDWPLQDELRNRELEKELEKRIRRKGNGTSDKDKYQDDIRDSDDRRLSARAERDEGGRYKDERHKDGSYRDKYRDDVDRDNRHRDGKQREDDVDQDNRHRDGKQREDDVDQDNRHRDGKQREDIDREKRHRDDKYRDEHASRDRPSNKYDPKHLKDESDAAESRNKRPRPENSNRDGSPIYDDRSIRYKDEKGKRRSDDKADQSDSKSRSFKELLPDAEKKSVSSGKAEPVTDRARSHSRRADVDSALSHSRRRISPSSSSHFAKDQYRYSKQVESKYRDSVPEERERHHVTSNREVAGGSGVSEKPYPSRSVDKSVQKDESYLAELSAERRPNSDARTSPMQLVEKSPSSSSTDRRHPNKAGVRRSLDVEEYGQRSGGFKDAKDYSGNGGKAIQDFSAEAFSLDELSQADGDNMSVSSPFSRTSHLPGNPKSFLPPPPPFRSGVDGSSVYGSSEDDNRGRSSNRFRRIGDSNMGRPQGNAWKGVPNWPSPVTNGFIPFHNGPPPVGFHPVMQQFSAPPMFGVRPSMELNHPGVPYHISDADRFSGHVRPFGWRNPVDDSCPPPLHGWDANNGVGGDGSHMYGRLDWDHNRTLTNGGGWETSGDIWKGKNAGSTMELPSAYQKEHKTIRTVDEDSAGHSGPQPQNDQNQLDLQEESTDFNQSGDALANDTFEAPKIIPEKTADILKISRNDSVCVTHVYLSKLDISADLTHPELYNQCTGLIDLEQNTAVDEDASNFVDVEEVLEAKVKIFNNTSSASLFAAINDSVLQRAMSLYKKQREEMMPIILPVLSNGEKVPFSAADNLEFVSTSDKENAAVPVPFLDEDNQPFSNEENQPFSNEDNQEMLVPASDQREAEISVPISDQEKAAMPIPLLKLEVPLATPDEKAVAPVPASFSEKPEELVSTLKEVKLEVDPVFNQETSKDADEDKLSSLENPVQSATNSPSNIEDMKSANDSGDNHSANSIEEQKVVDTICGPLVFSDVSSEACEAVMPESVEFGSVNLSRIHHSPESTH